MTDFNKKAVPIKFNIVRDGSKSGNDFPAKYCMDIIKNKAGYLTDDKGNIVNNISGKSYGSYILYIYD